MLIFSGDAIIESGDDPEVIRAKYFIRDEFLVSKIKLFPSFNKVNLIFVFSVFRQQVGTVNITVILISHVL